MRSAVRCRSATAVSLRRVLGVDEWVREGVVWAIFVGDLLLRDGVRGTPTQMAQHRRRRRRRRPHRPPTISSVDYSAGEARWVRSNAKSHVGVVLCQTLRLPFIDASTACSCCWPWGRTSLVPLQNKWTQLMHGWWRQRTRCLDNSDTGSNIRHHTITISLSVLSCTRSFSFSHLQRRSHALHCLHAWISQKSKCCW